MLDRLLGLYDGFLGFFPADWHGPISVVVALALVGFIWQILKKSGLWLILLVLLVPALFPALRTIALTLVAFVKALLARALP